MKTSIFKRNHLSFLAVCLLILIIPNFASAETSLVLVANDSLNVEASVSTSELKRVYLGKTKTLSGQNVKLISLKEGTVEQEVFMRDVLGMSSDEVKEYWIKESLKGGARPPRSMASGKSMTGYVKKKPGTVGYLNRSAASETGLKIIKIK